MKRVSQSVNCFQVSLKSLTSVAIYFGCKIELKLLPQSSQFA